MRIPFIMAAIAFVLAASQAQADHAKNPVQYTIGVVPQFEQRKLFKIWQPVIDELEKKTGLAFHLVGSPKIPVFEKKFLAGEYDFAYMNPYHVLKANASQGYIPLVKDGGRKLQGVLVVNKNNPAQDLAALNNRIFAFPSPNAFGASLLMRADLTNEHGITFFPRYVQTHSSVYLNVALGQADAGGGVMSTFNAQKQAVKDRLKIIYKTREVPPHPFAAHPRVPLKDRERVRKAWLELAASPDGQKLLQAIPMVSAESADISDYRFMLEWDLDQFYVTD